MTAIHSDSRVVATTKLPSLKDFLAEYEHAILQANLRLSLMTKADGSRTGLDLLNFIIGLKDKPYAPLAVALPGYAHCSAFGLSNGPYEMGSMAKDLPKFLHSLPIIFNSK